MINMINIVIII